MNSATKETAANGTNSNTSACPVDVAVALAPNNASAVPDLVRQINERAVKFASINGKDDGDAARHELLIKARTLVQALEAPRETMIKHTWAQTGALGGLIFGVESGLWKLMARNGQKPQKVTDLVAALDLPEGKMDPALLGRLLRHLAAMGYLVETGEDEYLPTNFTLSLSIDIIAHGYPAMLTNSGAAALEFHEWAREHAWQSPTDAADTSFHRAYDTKGKYNFFEYQHAQGYGKHFNNHMGGYRQGRRPWLDPHIFPVAERLLAGAKADTDAVLLVDVGGSAGHDLDEFRRAFPDAPGRLVLQDLPAVIAQVPETLNARIERQAHDFLTPQPTKGARAYYMHSVLHDWPDAVCETILRQLKNALTPGYSKILLHENVIPPQDTYWETSALDMVMLTCFSSRERTASDWYNLVEKMAGLKIRKIWGQEKGVESLIEVELA